MRQDIIEKLKESGLCGRGGAGFPVWLKWEQVKKAKADKKYIVCNAAEGDPGVFKDGFLLQNHLPEVVDGIKIALRTIKKSEAVFYLRKDYYKSFGRKIKKETKGLPVSLYKKPGGFLAGEETCVCAAIEGKRPEPRLKPPFPGEAGVFSFPTLINNVETSYYVSKIVEGEYKRQRFYCLSGRVKHKGVFELAENLTIKEILEQTGNYPKFDFFVQAGGGACGGIYLENELSQKIEGLGSIIVFDKRNFKSLAFMKNLTTFFMEHNCDKCAPCREGVYRISEILNQKNKFDQKTLDDLFFVMEETSFCGLGKGAPCSLKGIVEKVLNEK